eukprot:scaffold1941_cov263-Pinguiococcus_pyrenoidosus.AAC.22
MNEERKKAAQKRNNERTNERTNGRTDEWIAIDQLERSAGCGLRFAVCGLSRQLSYQAHIHIQTEGCSPATYTESQKVPTAPKSKLFIRKEPFEGETRRDAEVALLSFSSLDGSREDSGNTHFAHFLRPEPEDRVKTWGCNQDES